MVPTACLERLRLNNRCCAPSRSLLAGPSACRSPTSCSRRVDGRTAGRPMPPAGSCLMSFPDTAEVLHSRPCQGLRACAGHLVA